MKQLIYIAEDEKNIRETLQRFLENDGYEVCAFETGDALLSTFFKRRSDLVILDIMMPGTDGLTCCRLIREKDSVPIILLTAKDTEYDYVNGILQGGDDYLTKPIGTSELLARIRTALRHSNRLNTDSPLYKRPFHAKGLTIDFEKHLVSVDGKDVHLTQIEFKIISLLAQNSGRVMTYDTIISNIWGPYADDDNSILRVNMAHIRRKLEQNPAEPQYVFTEIGIGYRMIEDEMQ